MYDRDSKASPLYEKHARDRGLVNSEVTGRMFFASDRNVGQENNETNRYTCSVTVHGV